MKKMTSFLNLLAVSLVLFAGVNPANAVLPATGLAGFSAAPATFTNPDGTVVFIGGNAAGVGALPAWFQDQNGVAIKPCLDILNCGLGLGGVPNFDPLLPMQIVPGGIGTNFPSEAFYFNATASFAMPGASNVLLVMALEYTFVTPTGVLTSLAATPLAVGNPFQRLRLVHTFTGGGGNTNLLVPPLPAGGSFTVTHPWGVTTFPLASAKCVNSGGDTKCSMSRDLLPGISSPTAALGLGFVVAPDSTISTFLKSPAAPLGFLGSPAGTLAYTGGALGNTVTVLDPLGRTSGAIPSLKVLIGQTVGLEITPKTATFGVVKPANAPPLVKTFNINNLAGVAFTPVIVANVAASNPVVVSPDFTIVPSAVAPACALGVGALPLAIGATCNFDVIFNPTAPDGPKAADIAITGTGVPPVSVAVSGIGDTTAPTLTIDPISFTNVVTPTITGTAFDLNGVASVQVTVGGVLSTGVATITPPAVAGGPSTWSKVVTLPLLNAANSISVAAADTALTGGNLSAAQTFTITHDNVAPTVAPTITPVPNAGGFITTVSPTLTPGVTDNFSVASTIVTVDTTAPSTNVTPPTLVLGPLGQGSHTVKVDALDSASNPATKSISFNVDTIAPVVTITAPLPTVAPAITTPVITAPNTKIIGVTSPTLTFIINDANPDQSPLVTKATFDGVPLLHPIAFTTDPVTGKLTGTATLADPADPTGNTITPFAEGVVHHLTVDTTDLAGNPAKQIIVDFALILKDGSMTTLGATDPTIADVILALKVALGGFPEVANITPTTDTFKHGDVAPLNANGSRGDNKIDLSDVLTILKKVAGITTF